MSTRKTASKTSNKAKLNINVNLNKSSKRTSKKINNSLKKASPLAMFLAIFLLIGGALGGFFACKILTKNDCFTIIGKDEVTLTVGENYKDEGVKIIAFGQDDSDKVKITTNLTKNEDGTYTSNSVGTYYITYTVDNLKYGTLFKIQKIRLISFEDPTEQEEIDSANQGGSN